MTHAYLDELFASIQGEGPWVGQRHIFIRFSGCDIKCSYCDTETAQGRTNPFCAVQKSFQSLDREQVTNPVSQQLLSDLCRRLAVPGSAIKPVLSITGGEPLLQTVFLREWLPQAGKYGTIYLETSGIHHEAMSAIRAHVDIVSMDMKLPSATGLKPFWSEHEAFLKAAHGTGLFIKIVVTMGTTMEDVLAAAELIARIDRSLLLVIQPATGARAPKPEQLLAFQTAALGIIGDVRVIPQVHPILKVP